MRLFVWRVFSSFLILLIKLKRLSLSCIKKINIFSFYTPRSSFIEVGEFSYLAIYSALMLRAFKDILTVKSLDALAVQFCSLSHLSMAPPLKNLLVGETSDVHLGR